MHINIDQLTEAELVDLNRRIVERLRFLQQVRAHRSMLQYAIGDRVWFQSGDGRRVSGSLVRYNKKSVSVLADDGCRWTVSPSLLRPVEPRDITPGPGDIDEPTLVLE